MTIEFKAQKRVVQGTGASRRLRRAGRVPGVVYGSGQAAEMIELDHNEIFQCLRKEAFHSSVLAMILDGQKQMVLLRDTQVHAYKPIVLHVDFQRVDDTHPIHQKVPLHFINAEISPGVKEQGGIVSHVLNDVEVSCLAKDLPAFVEVDLKNLQSGHSLHVSDLPLPEGVKAVLHTGENPVVATILSVRGAAADEAPAGETPAA